MKTQFGRKVNRILFHTVIRRRKKKRPWHQKTHERVRAILDVLLAGLQECPVEQIELSRYSFMSRFLRDAAQSQHLFIFWIQLKHLVPTAMKINIPTPITIEEFQKLREDSDRFIFRQGFIGCVTRTNELLDLLRRSSHPDTVLVDACVQSYADVCAPFNGIDNSILAHALRECSVECVAALLDTPLPPYLYLSHSEPCASVILSMK